MISEREKLYDQCIDFICDPSGNGKNKKQIDAISQCRGMYVSIQQFSQRCL